MPEINFVNPQIHQIKNQELSIQVSLNGFSFLIRSAEDQICLLFRHYKFDNILLIDELIRKTEDILSSDTNLQSGFSKVEVTLISQQSAIIPGSYFNPDLLKKYFEFSHNLAEFDELHYTAIPEINAYNVFSIPGYLSQLFFSQYPSVKFNHQADGLIKLGFTFKNSDEVKIITGLNSGFFNMVIIEGSKLQLSNSYQYVNSTDLIYFLLYACQHLKIDIEKQKVFVVGESITNQKLLDEIASHAKGVVVPGIVEKRFSCSNLSEKQTARFYNCFL